MDSPDDVGAQPPGTRMSWVERVPQGVVKPLFGRVAWAFYIAAALTAVLLLVHQRVPGRALTHRDPAGVTTTSRSMVRAARQASTLTAVR